MRSEKARDAAVRRGDRPHRVLRLFQDAREQAEAAAAEMLGDVLQDERVAQVRLVGAVLRNRFRDTGCAGTPAGVTRLPLAELLEHAGQHRLDGVEHVFLRDEAHLEIELVELARRAVGARVLVAEARRDLEVAVEARHHQQLLELLRRLRQRVELAGMQARRHQEVARAFRRRRRQDRRLELREALIDHAAAQRRDHLAERSRIVRCSVSRRRSRKRYLSRMLLRIVRLAEHRQRQLVGRAQHLQRARLHLDLAGRQVRVPRLRRARDHLAVDPDHALGAHAARPPRTPARTARSRSASARNGRAGR